MKNKTIRTVRSDLFKKAQAIDPRQIAPGRAFQDLTPAEQQQRRQAYQNKRRLDSYNIQKGRVNTVSDFQPEAFISGFSDNLREKGLSNLASGAKSMGLGFAKGITDAPGEFAGIIGGLGSKIRGGTFEDGYNSGKDGTNRFLGLDRVNRKLDDYQQNVMDDYMKTNDMDANNLSGLDRWGMRGLDLAHDAGKAVGIWKSPGAMYKGLKGVGTAARAIRNPGAAIKSMTTAAKNIPMSAKIWNANRQMLSNPAARSRFISGVNKLKAQGANLPESTKKLMPKALRKERGFIQYHAPGLSWKIPADAGIMAMTGDTAAADAIERHNFMNRLSGSSNIRVPAINQIAGQTSGVPTNTSTNVNNSSYSTYAVPEDDIGFWLDR